MSKLLFVPVMLSIVFTLTANTKDKIGRNPFQIILRCCVP